MDNTSRLKYIARKGSDLDLADVRKKSISVRDIINFADRLLFKRPAQTFGLLIMLVALPISLYLTLYSDFLGLISEAEGGRLSLSTSEISDLTPNKIYTQRIELEGQGVGNLKFVEIVSPSWFERGNEVDGSKLQRVYKTIVYSGTPDFDLTERFSLLGKGVKPTDVSDCNGCDKDSKNLYVLSEFNLNTKDCGAEIVWGRNPVGNVGNSNSYCQRFENKCLISSSWKQFASYEECINFSRAPQITKFIEDKIYTFDVECDGSLRENSFTFDNTVEAGDTDGDIVRFSANSEGDFVNVTQDSIKVIVEEISAKDWTRYDEFKYLAQVKGEVTSDFIGTTTDVWINACDMLGKCERKSFDITTVQRSSCQFILPETGTRGINVIIDHPSPESEYKGIDNIVWTVSSGGVSLSEEQVIYDAEVKLSKESCINSNFQTKIADFRRLTLGKNKGYAVTWDSRGYEDGRYCVQVLLKDASIDPAGSGWEASDEVVFNVRNNNQNPIITSTPSKTDLVTGEGFEYKIEAMDPDGDLLNYDMLGAPSWLTFANQTVSGSTVVPGTYTFVAFVDDNHEGYDMQLVTINVSPPANTPSQIRFIFPTKDSVLKGANNIVEWEASDNEGISNIRLYYSSDGKSWTLIGTYPAGTVSTNWDVSSLENGTYYLQLVVVDGSDNKVETSQISEVFYVANVREEEQEEVAGEDTSMPAINNLTPTPDSEIYSQQPLVSASLHPSNDAEIVTESVKVYLNDEEITSECNVSKVEVLCELKGDLELGKHKVRIELTDSKDKQALEEWYFTTVSLEPTMEEQDTQQQEGEEYITIPLINKKVRKSALVVSASLCFSALLLILIPWLIYFLWSKRSQRTLEYSQTIQPQVQPQPKASIPPSPSSSIQTGVFPTETQEPLPYPQPQMPPSPSNM